MSLMGKLITDFMGKIMVFNPEKNKDILNSSFKMKELPYRAPKGYEWKRFDTETVSYETYRNKAKDDGKVILMLHGGGYLGPLLNLYRKYAKLLVDATGAKVYMLDYRLAPKYLFPAALDDAVAMWDVLIAEGHKEEDIIVIGDSAGGNLSLALMLKLRDSGRKLPHAGVLISPWADMLASGKSYVNNYSEDVMFGYRGKQFDESLREQMLDCDIYYYFREEKDRKNPYISPVFGEYHDFPECFFVAATNEMLRSDSETIVEKINAAGGKAELFCKHAMFHVYPIGGNICKESREANQAIIAFINRKFTD